MNKILKKHIDKKVVLIGYIFIQIIMHLFGLRALNNREYHIVEYLTIFGSLIYGSIVYIVLLFNDKEKSMIYYYSVSTTILNFFLILDISYLTYTNISYGYAQIIILFIILDITFKILTQNIRKGLFYKYIIILLWTIGMVSGILKIEVYLPIYQITFLIIIIYPIIFSSLNFRRIKNYGRHLMPIFLLLIIVNGMFLTWIYINPLSGMNNYDLYIYLNLLEVFLSYLVLSASKLWKLLKDKKIKVDIYMIIRSIFIIGYLYFIQDSKGNSTLILFSLLSIFIILKQIQLLNYYIKVQKYGGRSITRGFLDSNLLNEIVETNISDFKKEELYKEQVADFLHDEILQDAIYIKKELRDNYGISTEDRIYEIADRLINTTRGQISLYKPHINYEMTLADNYYNLIQSLKRRFGSDNILIDFICDDKLFLSSPYDLVIYRMLHELVTNIFKHSKGDFSTIELKVHNKEIFLDIVNYGDYLSKNIADNTESRGLKIVKREIDRFDGTLDITTSIDSDILENKNIFENSTVNISIRIPIKGEITYEHFINR